MMLTCGIIFWVLSEDARALQIGWGVSAGPECCNCHQILLLTSDTRSFQRVCQMQCLLQTATTSFHPHRLKTRHTQVSGVNGSRLTRFVTTELKKQWQLRIINITGLCNVINCCVNSCQQSFSCMQVYDDVVLWQACETLDMMSYCYESAISQ